MTSLNAKVSRGFSLIEMAIVLLIVSLLVGGLLVPLATQVQQRQIGETEKALEEIKDALVGFAVANDRLPRPATSFSNGAENAAPCVGATPDALCTGFVPWATLGITKLDAWGKIIRYSVTPAFTETASLTLTANGTKTITTRTAAGVVVNLATGVPAVVFSHGRDNWGTGEAGNAFDDASATNADEDVNQSATLIFRSRTSTENSGVSGGEFDDIVTWISSHVLFNRMVAAGKLP